MPLARYSKEPRVGVIVVTHEGSCETLLAAAKGLLGDLPGVVAVPISQHHPFDEIVRLVGSGCDQADEGAGVLILVDIHGSTPFHACMSMLDGTRPAEVLCGVNLPMLLKLATVDRRELRPAELAELLRDVGRRSIRLGSELTGKVGMAGPR